MSIILRNLLLLLLATLVISCGNNARSPQPSARDLGTRALLVAIEGTVQLKREGWSTYVPIDAGTILQPTDLLRTTGKATIVCANFQIETVTGLSSTPCPTTGGWLDYDGSIFLSRQRGLPGTIPFIIFPRDTLVLDERPRLRWNDTGAASYTVTLQADDQPLWTINGVTATEILYPADKPPLRPQAEYLLIITDENTRVSSLSDTTRGIGFRLAPEELQAVVDEQAVKIQQLDATRVDATSRSLILALYYANLGGLDERGLHGEALQLVEQVAKSRQTPAIFLIKGQLAQVTQLSTVSEASYLQAVQLAASLGDIATEAAAEYGLWQVKSEMVHLDRAIALYASIGEIREVERLKKERTQ